MSKDRNKDVNNLIRWCIEYVKQNKDFENQMMTNAYDEIKKYGFDNVSSDVYMNLIAFYTCKLLEDKNSAKYVSSTLNNPNIDISSVDNLYEDEDAARVLAKSLVKLYKGFRNTDGD